MQHLLQPTMSGERINSLDIIRGIALLGILLMNIVGFGLAYSYMDPTISGGSTGINLKVWIVNNMLFEGTMRGLFTMLFGSGFILLSTAREDKGAGLEAADIYYRRTIWLLVFGLIHSYLFIWFGEILYQYGVFGLMLFAFRKTSPKYLMLIGVGLLAIGSVFSVIEHHENLELNKAAIAAEVVKETNSDELTEEQQATLEKWEKKKAKKTPEDVEKENEALHKGYWSIVGHRVGMISYFQTVLMHEFWIWDILSCMLIGMALFKWGVFQGTREVKFYVKLMLVGYAIGLAVNYWETITLTSNNFEFLAISRAGQTYQLGRLFTTLGHIGLFMLFIKSGVLSFLQRSLAAVGKMALTNYLVHTVICNIIFMGFGLGMFGKFQRYELYLVVFCIWVLQLIYSPIWFNYFRYGPAEWLWRSLSYMKKQPFKIKG